MIGAKPLSLKKRIVAAEEPPGMNVKGIKMRKSHGVVR